jgi:hypothetical protein
MQQLECTLRKSNAWAELAVMLVRGELSEGVMRSIQALNITIHYVEPLSYPNKYNARCELRGHALAKLLGACPNKCNAVPCTVPGVCGCRVRPARPSLSQGYIDLTAVLQGHRRLATHHPARCPRTTRQMVLWARAADSAATGLRFGRLGLPSMTPLYYWTAMLSWLET